MVSDHSSCVNCSVVLDKFVSLLSKYDLLYNKFLANQCSRCTLADDDNVRPLVSTVVNVPRVVTPDVVRTASLPRVSASGSVNTVETLAPVVVGREPVVSSEDSDLSGPRALMRRPTAAAVSSHGFKRIRVEDITRGSVDLDRPVKKTKLVSSVPNERGVVATPLTRVPRVHTRLRSNAVSAGIGSGSVRPLSYTLGGDTVGTVGST